MTHDSEPPNAIIHVLPVDAAIKDISKGPLTKVGALKAVRLVMAAGEEVAEHKAGGAISVLCIAGQGIAGQVDFRIGDKTHHRNVHDVLCLESGTLHAVKAIRDSVLLVNICDA